MSNIPTRKAEAKPKIQVEPSYNVASDKEGAPRWTIQEFARQFDVTPRTIRFYEDKGLLSPSREAGARVFGPIDHTRLTQIMRAKRLGFALDDIKLVMDVGDGLVTSPAALARHQQNFTRVIRALRRKRKDIDILAAEMSGLCDVIDMRLKEAASGGPPDVDNVTQLARDYHTAFERHLAPETPPNINANQE